MGVDGVELQLTAGGPWESVKSVLASLAWTRRHGTRDGRAASDTVTLQLRGSRGADLVRRIIFAIAEAVGLRLLDGAAVVWTGDLLPGRAVDTDGDEAVVDLEAVDRLQRLRARASGSYSAAGADLRTVATQIATLAGIAVGDQAWPADLAVLTVGYAALEQGDAVWPILDEILWEHGWTLSTTETGAVTCRRWWLVALSPDPLTGLVGQLRLRQDTQIPAGVRVEWAETDTLERVRVWEAARDRDQEGELQPVAELAATGDQWPAEGSWLHYRSDWLAGQAPLARAGAQSPGFEVLRVSGHAVRWAGTGLALTTETHEAQRSQLRWTAQQSAAELRYAAIEGTVTFRAYLRVERATIAGAFGEDRVIRTRWLSSQAAAQRLAAAVRDRHDRGAWRITASVRADEAPELGAVVRVEDASVGVARDCVVLERHDFPMADAPDADGPVELLLQGIRALDATGAEADGRVVPAAAPVVTLGPRALWVARGAEATWSDVAAEAALGQPVLRDQVTQYQESGGQWTETRRWNGSAWRVVVGNLLASGNAPASVRTERIVALVSRGASASWSDAAANQAIMARVTGDTVIQFRETGGHWAQARYWTGSTWVQRSAQLIPGDLVVDGTLRAAALVAGGITAAQINASIFHTPLRVLAVGAGTTDNAIYDHFDAGAVLNGNLGIFGAILQSERVILPMRMQRTAASKIKMWFYGELLAPSGRVTEIEFSDGGTGMSLSDNLGEVLSGSWMGW